MADVSISRKLNLKCFRGDTFLMRFDFWEDCEGSTPTDLFQLAATFNCEVRDGEEDTDPIILSFTPGDFTIDGDDNNTLYMFKLDTDMNVPAGDYFYDIEMINGKNGAKGTIYHGSFEIAQDVTTN